MTVKIPSCLDLFTTILSRLLSRYLDTTLAYSLCIFNLINIFLFIITITSAPCITIYAKDILYIWKMLEYLP